MCIDTVVEWYDCSLTSLILGDLSRSCTLSILCLLTHIMFLEEVATRVRSVQCTVRITKTLDGFNSETEDDPLIDEVSRFCLEYPRTKRSECKYSYNRGDNNASMATFLRNHYYCVSIRHNFARLRCSVECDRNALIYEGYDIVI